MSTFGDLLDAGQFVDAAVCTTCLHGTLYDQWPADGEWTSARAERARATLESYQLTPGHLHAGAFSNCSHAGSPCPDDCACERSEFSHATCAVCGNTEPGDRHDAILVAHADLRP